MRHEPLVVIEGTKRDNRFAPSNAHGHLKKNRLCESLHCKCRRRPGQPFSASLRSRNAHGHVCHKSNFRREFQGKKAEPKIVKTPHRRVCASAAEMHMGNSKNAGDHIECSLIQPRPLLPGEALGVDTLFGENCSHSSAELRHALQDVALWRAWLLKVVFFLVSSCASQVQPNLSTILDPEI